MKAILNLRCPLSVQHLFIHSKPTIQCIIIARITAVMIFLKDNILVTDRDTFYQTKTYTISSTGGHFVGSRKSSIRMLSYKKNPSNPSMASNKMTTFDSFRGFQGFSLSTPEIWQKFFVAEILKGRKIYFYRKGRKGVFNLVDFVFCLSKNHRSVMNYFKF
jgi:hypothetical protein